MTDEDTKAEYKRQFAEYAKTGEKDTNMAAMSVHHWKTNHSYDELVQNMWD